MNGLTLKVDPDRYAVLRFPPEAAVPFSALTGSFWSVTQTREELSVVCPERSAPHWVQSETGWRALQVVGVLDFELVGILAGLSKALAEAGVSIFALSTYNTDYILLKERDLARAVQALTQAGYGVETD